MSEHQNNNYLWEYLYIISLTIIIGILSFLFFWLPFQLVLVLLAITIISLIAAWKMPLSKKLLYINNLLLLVAPLCFTYFITYIFIHEVSSFIGMIAGVAIMDVFSFTRSGRNTLNAKLSSNVNSLARLSVCLPVSKKPGLQPVIGAGDLTYYSFITMFSLKTGGTAAGLIAITIILIGQLVNIILIAIMKKKHYTKGFPATLFPGLFIIVAIILHIL